MNAYGVTDTITVEFTAIVGATDEIATGCNVALTRRGMRVPEDVSIAGWGGSEMSNLLGHPLTTVKTPMFQMGVDAINLLLEVLKGTPRHRHVVLDAQLVLAGSTGPAAFTTAAKSDGIGSGSLMQNPS